MKQVYYISHNPNRILPLEKRLQHELHNCGHTYEYADSLYILTTDLSLSEVYRKLKPYLNEKDRVFGM